MAYFRKLKADRQREAPKDPRMWGAKCDSCPLKGRTPVWGDGPEQPTLAIVGDSPGREDETAGIPFLGRPGQYVEGLLGKLGLNRKEVLLDNAVLCMPDGGDMKTFLSVAKKAFKAEQQEGKREKAAKFESPIDCCRPRLMFSLGVPRCSTCGGWDLRPEHPKRCNCHKPRWVKVKDRAPAQAVVAAGNAALESLEGHGGVMAKQAYVFEVKMRSRK